jgi:hypothetical protein
MKDCGPKPEDPVERVLWHFAALGNWGNLHVLDDERFDTFIAVAHLSEKSWTEKDVEKKLLGYGMKQKLVQPSSVDLRLELSF